jgi:hypothetical protein
MRMPTPVDKRGGVVGLVLAAVALPLVVLAAGTLPKSVTAPSPGLTMTGKDSGGAPAATTSPAPAKALPLSATGQALVMTGLDGGAPSAAPSATPGRRLPIAVTGPALVMTGRDTGTVFPGRTQN